MKKIWKAFVMFEIIVFVLFFGLWFNYEGNWAKEQYLEDVKNYNQGIYRPVIAKANTSFLKSCSSYNVEIKINPEKIANLNARVNIIPN